MAFRLIPRDARWFDLFLADGENLATAAERLRDLVESFDRLEERVAEIRVLEHRGDEIDSEINRHLEDAFVTPFDRSDIHTLISRLDDVVDGIQSVAETFVIYDVDAPTDEARRLAAILAAQAAQLLEAIRKLEKLKGLEPHLAAVHELENEADGLSRAAVARLFKDGLEPLEVIKWRDIYRELEESIDAAEDAGEAIERMVHKAT